MSLVLRILLVGVGLFGLFTVWTVLQVNVPMGLLLTALALGGLIVGWLWMIKIGRDVGNVEPVRRFVWLMILAAVLVVVVLVALSFTVIIL